MGTTGKRIHIKEDDFRWSHGASTQEYGDEVDPMWGYETMEITKEQVIDLMMGKVLYFPVNREYAVLLRVEKENKK